MANTEYGVNHPLAVKQWARKLFQEALKETYIGRFVGTSSNSLIQRKDDVSKDKGDRITIGLRMQLTGEGVAGDATLEGNEEALTTYHDNVFIDQLRHAVRSAGKMSEQRVPFSIREEAKDGLKDWWADRMDTAFFNQICGNTGQSDTKYTGMQAAIAPSADRIILADGTHTSEASLSTTDVFQLTFLDRALVKAKTATPLIRPIRYKGGEYYVAFLHPYQVYNLRTDATAARVTWYDAQKARVQGGEMDDNPIFSGALGIYNGIVLHESTRIPVAPTNSEVRRAVLCGAQAAALAFGQGSNMDKPQWYEELFDYGNQLGVEAGRIWGLKKMVFNGTDFGTIVISTQATEPA